MAAPESGTTHAGHAASLLASTRGCLELHPGRGGALLHGGAGTAGRRRRRLRAPAPVARPARRASPTARRRLHWPVPGECPALGPAHRRTARGTRPGLGQPQFYPRILDGFLPAGTLPEHAGGGQSDLPAPPWAAENPATNRAERCPAGAGVRTRRPPAL